MKMNGNWLPRAGAWTSTTIMLGFAMAACLTRPVGTQPPTTKVNFTSTQVQQAIDKVDILFAIDNSASMGDKQDILKEAVPGLLNGLIYPHCVDPDTGAQAPTSDADITIGRADPVATKTNHYGCQVVNDKQYDAEFRPVTDMHIGVISSSLGSFGGDQCLVSDNPRNNDSGHLLGSASAPQIVPTSNYLAWFPQSEENTTNASRHPTPSPAIVNSNDLSTNFAAVITDVKQNGCGLEAQLESMYHFLIQPDPWTQVKVDGAGKADLGDGVDWDLLAQRAAFLRPDSLVAVIMLTDEDDSSADPLAVGGQGWAFMNSKFPSSPQARGGAFQGTGSTAPRGTSTCDSDPGNANCTSCGFKNCTDNTAACQQIKQDKNCTTTDGIGVNGYYAADEDSINVRFIHMKQRYGVDPQYPVQRYINGFQNTKVPDRKTEHTVTTDASGNRLISAYNLSGAKCTNPLFAAALPKKAGDETCLLTTGTRSPSSVFFAIVGGVPNQLLYGTDASGNINYVKGNADANRTTSERWTKILGADPVHYNYDGIDVHMVQSVTPRSGLDNGDGALGQNGSDPITGREWHTAKSDLQYACTFPLKQSRDCGPANDSCDCATNQVSDTSGATKNPPLCDATKPTTQIRAKAYPTVRELEVARAMGDQGIAASLCPISLTVPPTDETYGYNPAVAAIVDRLKNALTVQCLPQTLRDADAGADQTALEVPCLILAQLPAGSPTSCSASGLQDVDPDVLKVFLEQQKAQSGTAADGAVDLSSLTTCKVPQTTVAIGDTCKNSSDKVWCYVENSSSAKPAGRCSQAIIFSAGTQTLAGARFALQCIKQFAAGEAAGDTSSQ